MDYELDTPLDSDEVYIPTSLLSLTGQQFADFNFTPLGDFEPGTYTLIDAGSISGTLGASIGGTINGLPASIVIQGNDLVLTVVPEPSSFVLLLAAGAGILGLGRRRRKRTRCNAGGQRVTHQGTRQKPGSAISHLLSTATAKIVKIRSLLCLLPP